MITGQNYIAGNLSSEGDKTFKTFDPERNTDNPWEFVEASENEIDVAVNSATAAFMEFSVSDDSSRADLLRRIVENIEGLGDELLSVYCQESGLPLTRARVEKARTLNQLKMFANLIESKNWRDSFHEDAVPDRSPISKPSLFKTYIPLGPIAVFGASNFPFAYSTAGGDTASALAAGCPVVVKSHPMHAGTGELVASAITKAIKELNLHPGIFSNLNSSGIAVGKQLALHDGVKAIGFTGSINGGRALFNLAASRNEPIPVFAEMGSINPIVISTESLKNEMEHWVGAYSESITKGTGQFCTNPGLVFGVKSERLNDFANKLAKSIADRPSTVMLHPNIEKAFSLKKAKALMQPGVEQITPNLTVKANYASQTITKVAGIEFLKNPTLHQEVFGPYTIIVECENITQITEILKNIEGQLTGTIIAQKSELGKFKELIQILSCRVGRLIYNGVPTGVEVTRAMTHGGPYPASSDSRFTAVGQDAIKRWLRPITYQNFPKELISGL